MLLIPTTKANITNTSCALRKPGEMRLRSTELGLTISIVPHCAAAVVGKPGPVMVIVVQYAPYAATGATVFEVEATAGATTVVVVTLLTSTDPLQLLPSGQHPTRPLDVQAQVC